MVAWRDRGADRPTRYSGSMPHRANVASLAVLLLLVPIGFAQGAATASLELMRLAPEDLPPGFELDSRFVPSVPANVVTSETAGDLFRKELRPHAVVVVGSSLYAFPSAELATSFYERFAGEGAEPLDGLGVAATLRQRQSADGERAAIAILLRRGTVVALVVGSAFDGNAEPADRLAPDEAPGAEALLEIARRLDRKIAAGLGGATP